MSIIDAQLVSIVDAFPHSSVDHRQDGTSLITVRDVGLCSGWNQTETTVCFLAPVGFPMAQPDCFWTDGSLRLASGSLPKNSGLQVPPFDSATWLWFSWHLAHWNPSRNGLKSYFATIRDRLKRPE